MIDLRKKEASKNDVGNPYAKEGVAYVLIYKGSEEDANKLSNALHKKPSAKNGNTWYFKYMSDRDAYSALDNNESKFKGLSYKQIKNDDWKKIKDDNDLKKENTEENIDMLDLREKKTSKKEDDMEIKFINKGDEFKSDKADVVKIIDVDKKDDKTEVTYKLGDEEKKGDIEDVLKMLNGAEYSKVEDKKDDEKKESAVVEAEGKKFVIYCTSKNEKDIPSGYVGDNDNYKTLKDLIAAEGKDVFFDSEKKAKDLIDNDPTIQANIKDGAKYTIKDVTDELDEKKESAEDDFVEVTLAEDFHVPGTDIVLEAGDVIHIIPKKED